MSELQDLAIAVVDAVWDKCREVIVSGVVKKSQKTWERLKVDFGLAFSKYLEQSYGKYSTAKTLLYTDKPRPIRDFFVIPTLQCGRDGSITANGIHDVVGPHRFVIIRGAGGIGKSTLMKHLFLSALDEKKLIPIFFELRELNDKPDDYDMADVLFEKMGGLLTSEAIEYALEKGLFLFLLDGCDEVVSNKTVNFTKKLNKYCDKYPQNSFVVSARPYGEGSFLEFNRFKILTTCGLEWEQTIELIHRLEYDVPAKRRFMNALAKGLYSKYKSFASNPLLLTMMFLTYDANAEIPEKKYLFYERVFETLFFKHDATKECYKRELKSKLQYDLFQTVFSCFCCQTYYSNKYKFRNTSATCSSVLEKRVRCP